MQTALRPEFAGVDFDELHHGLRLLWQASVLLMGAALAALGVGLLFFSKGGWGALGAVVWVPVTLVGLGALPVVQTVRGGVRLLRLPREAGVVVPAGLLLFSRAAPLAVLAALAPPNDHEQARGVLAVSAAALMMSEPLVLGWLARRVALRTGAAGVARHASWSMWVSAGALALGAGNLLLTVAGAATLGVAGLLTAGAFVGSVTAARAAARVAGGARED